MILGIDLGGTNIRIGQIEDGRIVKKTTAPSPSDMKLDESINYLKATIKEMLTSDTTGIGIGVPSVLDSEKGIVYNVANIPSWEEVHLKEILEAEFNIPVFVNNDSNCFTIGEKRFGEGKPFRNMVGITLGTGVGAGVVIDNNLYNGSNTGSGEIGCIPYLESDYEHYCASSFFTTYHGMTGFEAAQKAATGDVNALKIWHEYGTHLGQLIQTALFAYDPDAIIFGGGITAAYPLFEKSMRENLKLFPYPKSLVNLQIRISSNPNIAILGAAALVKV